jgi:hypothetical protein
VLLQALRTARETRPAAASTDAATAIEQPPST